MSCNKCIRCVSMIVNCVVKFFKYTKKNNIHVNLDFYILIEIFYQKVHTMYYYLCLFRLFTIYFTKYGTIISMSVDGYNPVHCKKKLYMA